MNWDVPYVVSRSLTFEVSSAGKLMVAGSLSRQPHVLQLDGLPVLLGFASAATPREVLGRLQQEWELEEAGFGDVVRALADQELLRPVDDAQERPALTSSSCTGPACRA